MVKKVILDEEHYKDVRNPVRNRGNRFQDDQFRKHSRNPSSRIIETKLFTSRDKLVEYVNEKGQSDAFIDIYKIEEDLYKLVIKH